MSLNATTVRQLTIARLDVGGTGCGCAPCT
jgi:hypothetical protein